MGTKQTTLNLIQRALQFKDLEMFMDALNLSHLVDVIKSGGPFTVFAPVNSAFIDIPEPILSILKDDESLLITLIQHHVVPGKYSSADLLKKPDLRSLIGGNLYASFAEDHLWINSIQITRGDLEAANGVLHIVDGLLLPKSITEKAEQAIVGLGVTNV